MKKKTASKQKNDLDRLFSEYIRRKYSDQDGIAECYTCYVRKPWKEMQNGHFVSRSQLATRFLESNCRVQCVGCNIFGGGKVTQFANRLESETPGIVALLYREANKITKDYPYEAKIEEYKEKLKSL